MKTIFKLMTVLAGLLFYVGQCEAACNFVSFYQSNNNIGNIIVQRDLPIGQTIAQISLNIPSPSIQHLSCNTGYINYELTYPSSQSTGIPHVYSTNLPGVGFSIVYWNTYYFEKPVYSRFVNGPLGVYLGAQTTLTLVKTGPITSGQLQTGMMGRIYGTGDGRDAEEIYLTGGSITQVACSITTPNVNVPLDPVLAGSFTGVNSTKGPQPFTIGLSCDAGARINASLSFTQNTGTANNSVIQLTGAGTAGVATGVGIQLLYGSTVLQNNTNIVLKTSTGGSEFPPGAFTARYFQTAATVTPGDANATATLNLTYQ